MQDSYQLYLALKNLNFKVTERDPWWWPHSGQFAIVAGALLTQQTRWEKVEESLANLTAENKLSPGALATLQAEELIPFIKPSGFYNTKAERLIKLCQNLEKDFGNFENFQRSVNRQWLLKQTGIGQESADAILCYGAYREQFVVDAYTTRLVNALGHPFDRYEQVQAWMIEGLQDHRDHLQQQSQRTDLALVYAHYHGMIVEYCKQNSRGKNVQVDKLYGQGNNGLA